MIPRVAWWLALEAGPTLRAAGKPPSEIRALAERRLRAVLATSRNTAFYGPELEAVEMGGPGPRNGEAAFDVLQRLPTVNKRTLREAGADVLVGGRVRPEWRSSRSSGSTGEPFEVHFDARGWAIAKYLVKWRARALCGARLRDRITVLDAVPPGYRSPNVGTRAGRLRVVSLLQPIEVVARELHDFQPAVVYGPPSAFAELADLPAGEPPWRPRLAFASGELLQESVREHVKGAWQCSVLDTYGTSETKEVAFECRRGSWHVNEDVVRIEVVDEQGHSVPPGTDGEIVVTSLINRAMPLLRYRPGDRGSLVAGPCGCGLPFGRMGLVSGRTVDVVTLPGNVRVSPYALTMAIEGLDGLRQYQIQQTADDRLHVKVIRSASAGQEVLAAQIREGLGRATGGLVTTTVEFVEEMVREPGRKFEVVQRVPDNGRR